MKFAFNVSHTIMVLCLSFLNSALAQDIKLEQLWETSDLNNPESVVYDDTSNTLYVSNVNGQAGEKDGNGYISRLASDGKILDLQWVKGLNGPTGLTLSGDKLYVADIDTLVEIDIATAAVSNRYQVADAKFMNDVAGALDGSIYVSDMVMNRIYQLRDGKFSIWIESPELLNPNGLLVQDQHIIVGAWGVMTDGFNTKIPGQLLKVSLCDRSIQQTREGRPVGNLDGVAAYNNYEYLVTDWLAGKLLLIDIAGEPAVADAGTDHTVGKVTTLLTLTPGSGDLAYIKKENLVLIPMMQDNKLIAYKIMQ